MNGKNDKNRTDNNEQAKIKNKNDYSKKQANIQYILSLLNLEPNLEYKEKLEINKEKKLNLTEKKNKRKRKRYTK